MVFVILDLDVSVGGFKSSLVHVVSIDTSVSASRSRDTCPGVIHLKKTKLD